MPVVSRKEWKKTAEKGRGETPSSVSGRCVGWCHGARQSPRQDARCWEAAACRLGDHGVPATYPAAPGPSPPALAVRTQPLGGHPELPAVRRGCTEPAALRAFPSTDPGGHTPWPSRCCPWPGNHLVLQWTPCWSTAAMSRNHGPMAVLLGLAVHARVALQPR